MTLDLSTAYLFGGAVQIGVAMAMTLVAVTGKIYRGFAQWTLASSLSALGFVLFSMRGGLDPSVSVLTATVLLMLAGPVYVEGLLLFLAPPRQTLLRGLNLFTLICWIGVYVAKYAYGGGANPVIPLIVGVMVHVGILIVTVPWAARRYKLPLVWLVLGCVCIEILVHLPRLSFAITHIVTTQTALAGVGLIATLAAMMTAFVMVELNSQRLEMELRATQIELEQVATTDALTGLRTRRSFFEQARVMHDLARRHRRPFTILMCDLDHFKQINDAYGHAVGDAALVLAAETIARMLRQTDLAGRIGGEEFCVALAETDLNSAMLAAERIRASVEAIEPPWGAASAPRKRLTISIGVCAFDHDGAALEELVRRADEALYRAKEAGRNRWAVWRDGDVAAEQAIA